jgi:hypothetical protein
MSTTGQVLSAALHGEALLTARRPELQLLIDHLREVAQGRDDIRTECAGVITGAWFANKARRGEELIAAGLLVLAGHTDLDEWIGGCVWVGSSAAGRRCRTRTATIRAHGHAIGVHRAWERSHKRERWRLANVHALGQRTANAAATTPAPKQPKANAAKTSHII